VRRSFPQGLVAVPKVRECRRPNYLDTSGPAMYSTNYYQLMGILHDFLSFTYLDGAAKHLANVCLFAVPGKE
jgi:hypothetical protein